MKAFEVSINGHRVCLAGVGDAGVLHAIVGWVGGFGPDPNEDLSLSVCGLEKLSDEHLRWHAPSLGVGAEVLVRVVEAAAVDPPDERFRHEKRRGMDEYRELFRECAQDLSDAERAQLRRELVAELQGHKPGVLGEPGVGTQG